MDALTVYTAIAGAGSLATIVALVRIAVMAERRRADDWRTAAQTSTAANIVLTGHFDKLISTVEQLASSQREMMALLQRMASQRQASP